MPQASCATSSMIVPVFDISDEHGPFFPPPDYKFEPCLRIPPPRPLPVESRDQFERKRKLVRALQIIAVGLAFMALHPVPAVRSAGQYFILLHVLFWLGLALLVPALSILFSEPPRERLLRRGTPVVGRVVGHLRQTHRTKNGAPFEFVSVHYEYRHPSTGTLREASQTVAAYPNDVDTLLDEYPIGRYVTVLLPLYSPGSPTGLHGLATPEPLRKPLAQLYSADSLSPIFVFFVPTVAFLAAGLWALDHYLNLLLSPQQALWIALGGGLAIAAAIWALKRLRARQSDADTAPLEQAQPASPDLDWDMQLQLECDGSVKKRPFSDLLRPPTSRSKLLAFAVSAGFLFVACAAVLTACLSANCAFDGCAAHPTAVRIIDTRVETVCMGLVRQYKVRFQSPESDLTLSWSTSPENMTRFAGTATATATVRQGRLGWPWVERLEPGLPPTSAP